MSAFICGPDHIKALAVYAIGRRHGSMRVGPNYLKYDGGDARIDGRSEEEIATYYANILYCENIRSVQSRYPDDSFDDLPGLIQKPEMLEVTHQDIAWQAVYGHLKAVDILKMCDCLEYQSCETDDYRSTLAFKLLDRIRGAAIHDLPGYDSAPWEWEKPEQPKQPAPVKLSDVAEFVRRMR